jgi:hypothetical protein
MEGSIRESRNEAVAAFTRLGSRARAAIPDLLMLTQDTDSQMQAAAWQALAQVAGDDFGSFLNSTPVDLGHKSKSRRYPHKSK